ncbi:MAG: hypothetical protein V1807_01000 [Patescibacteria group bacterium]
MQQQDTGSKKHILVTTTPVIPGWVTRFYPLLAKEFPKDPLVCVNFPGDTEKAQTEITRLLSDPTKVVVVDIDSLQDKHIRCLLSARQATKGSFYIYSKIRCSLELMIPGCKPGTCAVTLPRQSNKS